MFNYFTPGYGEWCCCQNFYVEAEGGFATSLGKAKNRFDVGVIGSEGIAFNPEFRPGGYVGVKLGYVLLSCFRIDVSYSFFTGDYDWEGAFNNEVTEIFEADLDSHVVLCNAYLHIDRLCCSPCDYLCLSPYAMGGVGAAWNHLENIGEFALNALVEKRAEINSKWEANFAGRFGFGVLTKVFECLFFDVGVHATFIGDVSSDDTRLTIQTNLTEPINPYKFKNNWIGAFYIGLQYPF